MWGTAFTKHSFEAREARAFIAGSQNLAKYFQIWRPEHYIFELAALLLFSAMTLCWCNTMNVTWRTWHK